MTEEKKQDQERVEDLNIDETVDTQDLGPASNKKKFLAIGLTLLFIIGVSLYFLLGKSNPSPKESKEETHKASESSGPSPSAGDSNEEVFYDLKNFVVNLYSQDGKQRFLKLTLTLHLKNSQHLDEIAKKIPLIRDSFQFYLRELRVSDLSGSERLMILKEELLLRINKILNPIVIEDILFKEILIN